MHATPARAPIISWLGGLLFVISLAVFLYSYFVRFAEPARTDRVAAPVVVDVLLFTLFALHHSVLARTGAKRWLARHLAPALERTAYVLVASVLFLVVCLCWQPVGGLLYKHSELAAAAHWVLVLAGILLTAQAASVLDPLDLAGIRQAAGQLAAPDFKVAGPYRWLRHPIYLGWMLMVFGVPHMTGTRLVFAVVSSLYLVVAIPLEERSLVEALGPTYRDYQRRVRWRLMPGVW